MGKGIRGQDDYYLYQVVEVGQNRVELESLPWTVAGKQMIFDTTGFTLGSGHDELFLAGFVDERTILIGFFPHNKNIPVEFRLNVYADDYFE